MGLLVIQKTKKVLSGCRRFSTDFRTPYGFEHNGWRFVFGTRSFEDLPVLRRRGVVDLSIINLSTGINLCFNPLHALRTFDNNTKLFPTYASPSPPTPESFHSGFTGRVYLKGKESHMMMDPNWENVDWNAVCERVVWLSSKDHWPPFQPATTFFQINESKDPYLFFVKRDLYPDCSTHVTQRFAYFYMVITTDGWWLRLLQTFPFCDITKRVMDMHFNFADNVIYREIIEFQRGDPRVSEEMGDELSVHFHEVKQLKIGEGCMGTSIVNKDAIKYQSFTMDEWLRSSTTGLTLSRAEVTSLFANWGRQIQSFEQNTKTRLQSLPLFGVPQGQRVYLTGAEEDVEAAKSILACHVLGRERCHSKL